jgi:hypothetical protein
MCQVISANSNSRRKCQKNSREKSMAERTMNDDDGHRVSLTENVHLSIISVVD